MWFQAAFVVFLTFQIKQNAAQLAGSSDSCWLPNDTGPCDTYVERWYYDKEAKTCRKFIYGGCGGNKNNFETLRNCVYSCGSFKKNSEYEISSRIANEDLSQQQQPWMAALHIQTPAGRKFCAGTLISADYVLTSDTCIEGATEIEVVLGAYNYNNRSEPGQKRMTSKVTFQHDECTKGFKNDLGLIKLPSPVEFSDVIKAIKIYPLRWIWDNDKVDLPGWGKQSSTSGPNEKLVTTTGIIKLDRNNKCAQVYPTMFDHDRNLCVAADDTQNKCNRDNGGPMIYYSNYFKEIYVVAVGSFSISAGCDEHHLNVYPDVYIRTHLYADWLNKYTQATDKHYSR